MFTLELLNGPSRTEFEYPGEGDKSNLQCSHLVEMTGLGLQVFLPFPFPLRLSLSYSYHLSCSCLPSFHYYPAKRTTDKPELSMKLMKKVHAYCLCQYFQQFILYKALA